jgi:SOS response regulatory protein OraA/RecX
MNIILVKKQKNRLYRSEEMAEVLCGVKLFHGPKGEPLLENGHISVSDTKNYWACALSEKPVGIDMEELSRNVSEAVVRRLHPREAEYLSALAFGSSEWKEEFLSIWTKKESYSKYLGKGLSLGFSSFCVLEGKGDLKTSLFSRKYKGLVISATEEFEVVERSYDAPKAKTALDAGADILDMAGCSSETLKKKLIAKGYTEDESEAAVAKLTELGFLNDGEYAGSLGRKYAQRGYSSARIAFELRKKGVGSGLSGSEASKYREGDRDRALSVAEKLCGYGLPDEKMRGKIARKLSSLGYDTSTVYDIIQKLNNRS